MICSGGCDWLQFRAGASHQGITYGTTIDTTNVAQLQPEWTGETGGAVFSSPAVADGVAYVGSDDGKLYAFDASGGGCSGTCDPLWTADPGGGGGRVVAGSPAVVDGIVHVGTACIACDDGFKVAAYDAAGITNCSATPTGKVCEPLWEAPRRGFVDNAAMVWNGTVFYGDGSGEVAAFDAAGIDHCSARTPAAPTATCSPLWTAHVGSPIHSSPTYYDGRVFVGADDGNVYAFDAMGIDGCTTTAGHTECEPLLIAQTGTGSWIAATPAVSDDGTLFVATLDIMAPGTSPAFAFDANGVTNCSTGAPIICSPLWTAAGTTDAYASPAISGDYVFFTKPGRVLAYDRYGVDGCTTPEETTMKTCSPVWETKEVTAPPTVFGAQYFSSPAIARGVLYIGALDGRVYAYDATGTSCPKPKAGTATKECGYLKWWQISDQAVTSSPTIVDDHLYIGSSHTSPTDGTGSGKLWCFGF